MTTPKRSKIPSLRSCHGRGFVELSGRRIYLGPSGAPETQKAYDQEVAVWIANGRSLPVHEDEITVVELCVAFWDHCCSYYAKPAGGHSSSLDRVRQALRPLREVYGPSRAIDFGPRCLRTVREMWIRKGLARKTVNDYTAVVTRMFRWAASHELVPATVHQTLSTVEGLRPGRSSAKETVPVRPVSLTDVNAIEGFVSRQVWALIQLQLLTGARPGELVKLRPIDFDMSELIWTVDLAEHKTSHRGKQRTLYFGPKSQAIVHEFMADRSVHSYLFSPGDAETERHASAKTHRRPDQHPNPRKSSRTLGDHYTTDSYRKAVVVGCKKARVASWTPNRLRHTRMVKELRRRLTPLF